MTVDPEKPHVTAQQFSHDPIVYELRCDVPGCEWYYVVKQRNEPAERTEQRAAMFSAEHLALTHNVTEKIIVEEQHTSVSGVSDRVSGKTPERGTVTGT